MNLKQLLHGHAATLLERPSTKAILSDAFNNDIPKINALMSAYDVGIVTAIQAHFPLSNLERSNAINKLIKQHSMLEDKAAWAVDQWIAAVDSAVIREMQEAQIIHPLQLVTSKTAFRVFQVLLSDSVPRLGAAIRRNNAVRPS